MFVEPIVRPTCCKDGAELIAMHRADPPVSTGGVSPAYRGDGPDSDGWAMPYGASEEAWNDVYINVAYCPFCGAKLPPGEVGQGIIGRSE